MAAAVAAGLLVLSDGGGDGEEALPVPTQAVVGASTGVTATATPRPEALKAFPPVVWTEVGPQEVEEAADGNMFLLDLETGRLYQPTQEVLTREKRVRAFISWADNGWITVAMAGTDSPLKDRSERFAGETLGAMQRLPSSGPAGSPSSISSKGVLAYRRDEQIVLYDVVARSELATIEGFRGYVDGWSPDGRYLTLIESRNKLSPEPPSISVLDEQGVVVDVAVGDELRWAPDSKSFVYEAVDPVDPEERVIEARVRNPETGEEEAVSESSNAVLHAPRGRFIVIPDHQVDSRFDFRILETSSGRDLVTLRGVFISVWLDEDTLAFTGDACNAHGFYSIDADGSNLTLHVQFERYAIAHPSRQGDRIAWSLWGDGGGFVTTVQDLTTGETREYLTGDAVLPHYSGIEHWSPDGRYLALIKPGGRDGICFSQQPQELEVEVH